MSKAKLGKSHDAKTKEAIPIANGTPVYLYKIQSEPENFLCAERVNPILIKIFSSLREAAKYLNISHSTAAPASRATRLAPAPAPPLLDI